MIESFTYLQNEQLSIYRDKWIRILFSTESANRKEAEKYAKQMYDNSKTLTVTNEVHWVLSPTESLALADDITINIGSETDRKHFQYTEVKKKNEISYATFDFYIEVLGINMYPMKPFIGFMQNAEFVIPFEEFMIICDRPKNRTILDDGSVVVEYRDGTIGTYETHKRDCFGFYGMEDQSPT